MKKKFYVNEEKKTIVCEFDRAEAARAIYNDINKCYKTFGETNCLSWWDFVLLIGAKIPSYVSDNNILNIPCKGTAKCWEGDEWDEEIGKKVAEQKALTAYYKARDKIFDAYINELTYLVDLIKWKK